MVTATKVTKYKANDGTIHDSVKDAESHELQTALNGFWGKYGYSGMSAQEASDITLSNVDELRKILNGKKTRNTTSTTTRTPRPANSGSAEAQS